MFEINIFFPLFLSVSPLVKREGPWRWEAERTYQLFSDKDTHQENLQSTAALKFVLFMFIYLHLFIIFFSKMPPAKPLSTMASLAATVSFDAVSHDIWLFTNYSLMAECRLTNTDLAFYHEWPSIFNSGKAPKTQHIFSHQDTVHLTVTWIKATVPSHHTDQTSKHAIVDSTRKQRKSREQQKKKKKKKKVYCCCQCTTVIQMRA